MHLWESQAAIEAAVTVTTALGLPVDDIAILHNSNRLALHLRPCDVVARVANLDAQGVAAFEVEVARRLAETNSPVALLHPRAGQGVYQHGAFAITLWDYYEPVSPRDTNPAEYARALLQLHAGMRQVTISSPHFSDRTAEALRLISDPSKTPELRDADRVLLQSTLQKLTTSICRRGVPEQLLHGEPHPGNLLRTKNGLLFVDWETCCRGPVEFDLAHLPEEVSAHYPGVDQKLLDECRMLMLAMVAAWRWDRDDQLPDGRKMGNEYLARIRTAMDHHQLDALR